VASDSRHTAQGWATSYQSITQSAWPGGSSGPIFTTDRCKLQKEKGGGLKSRVSSDHDTPRQSWEVRVPYVQGGAWRGAEAVPWAGDIVNK
jgi:hypothetical protein